MRRSLAACVSALAALAAAAGCGEDASPEEQQTLDRAGLVGASPRAVAAGAGSVWVIDDRGRSLWRFAPSPLRRRGAPVRLPGTPVDVDTGAGAVWVVVRAPSALVRIDPRTGRPGPPVPLRAEPVAMDAGSGGVWVATRRPNAVVCLDRCRGAIAGRPVRLAFEPAAVGARDAALWVASTSGRRLVRLDPATGEVRRSFRAPNGLASLAAGDGGSAWFAQGEADPFGRAPIEGDYLELIESEITPGSVDVAVGPRGAVYVLTGKDSSRETSGGNTYTARFRTVLRLDPKTGAALGSERVGDDAWALAAGEGAAWVLETATGNVPSGSKRVARAEP